MSVAIQFLRILGFVAPVSYKQACFIKNNKIEWIVISRGKDPEQRYVRKILEELAFKIPAGAPSRRGGRRLKRGD